MNRNMLLGNRLRISQMINYRKPVDGLTAQKFTSTVTVRPLYAPAESAVSRTPVPAPISRPSFPSPTTEAQSQTPAFELTSRPSFPSPNKDQSQQKTPPITGVPGALECCFLIRYGQILTKQDTGRTGAGRAPAVVCNITSN